MSLECNAKSVETCLLIYERQVYNKSIYRRRCDVRDECTVEVLQLFKGVFDGTGMRK